MNHPKLLLVLPTLLLVATLSGCSKTYKGEGAIVSDIREIGTFDKVALNMDAIVRITDTTGYGCTVNAQQNLLEAIVTRLDGKTLVITTKGDVDTDQPIEILLNMERAQAFEVNGSGEISSTNTLKNEYIDFEVNGSGHLELDAVAVKITGAVTGSGMVNLTGSANDLDVEINGSGSVNAERFSVLRSKAKISGSGEILVLAEKSLDAHVNGSGIVSYRGNAVVDKKISGSGEVKKLD